MKVACVLIWIGAQAALISPELMTAGSFEQFVSSVRRPVNSDESQSLIHVRIILCALGLNRGERRGGAVAWG
jgi:hypothetical protein